MEQFEALERLASQLGDSLQVSGASRNQQPLATKQQVGGSGQQLAPGPPPPPPHSREARPGAGGASGGGAGAEVAQKLSKWQLYNCERADEVFSEVDARAINIAQEDQQTFTELVHHLTRHCLSDIEKARAIFRWITVKNLNTMHFGPSVKADTPMGLLRGIKQGSESYHVLFKRLCR